jgi:colicin import membrane protein
LIQKRINSIWKKPSLINQNIKTEIQINLAPSGEILKYEMISSSGNKIFDDSAFRALANISFITEVIGMDRNYFERNFRSFNLVFKSKD